MKKFISILASLAVLYTSFAAVVTYAPSGSSTGTSILGSQPVTVNRIDVANSTTNSATITFFDAPGATLTFTTAAYTNRLTYSTNIITSWTAITGVTYTETNNVVYTIPNTVAAATNTFRALTTITVPANSTASWIPTGFSGSAGFGLAATNNIALTATINYSTPK